jgi:hypothetical protein
MGDIGSRLRQSIATVEGGKIPDLKAFGYCREVSALKKLQNRLPPLCNLHWLIDDS